MRNLSVVIPVFNCEKYLHELISRLLVTLRIGKFDYEIIFIDDGSSDDAWKIIESEAMKDKQIKAVRLSRNHGQHAAIRLGLLCTSKDVIAVMDADLQNVPEDLEKLYSEIANGYDVVHTIRASNNKNVIHNGIRNFIYFLGSLVGTNKYHKGLGNFKMFTRKVKEQLDFSLKKIFVLDNRLARISLKEKFVYITRPYRTDTTSRYTFWRYVRLLYRSVSELSVSIEVILILILLILMSIEIQGNFSLLLKLNLYLSLALLIMHYIYKFSAEKYFIKHELNFVQPVSYYLQELN